MKGSAKVWEGGMENNLFGGACTTCEGNADRKCYHKSLFQSMSEPSLTSSSSTSLVGFLNFIYLYQKGEGREKERERNSSVWLPVPYPILGTWPTTQACAWVGIEPVTLWFSGGHWIYWAVPTRASLVGFNHQLFHFKCSLPNNWKKIEKIVAIFLMDLDFSKWV